MTQSSQASTIVKEVYHQHVDHFGEPDDGWVFDEEAAKGPTLNGMPKRIDVFAWYPSEEIDITTFATIGMSDQPMFDAGHRGELHFAVRGQLEHVQIEQCLLFLANLAMYPFQHQTQLDWWHKINSPGKIAMFPNAKSILIHPRFVEEGWDHILCQDGTLVKLLNVIPLGEEASSLKTADELSKYVWETLEDPFTPW